MDAISFICRGYVSTCTFTCPKCGKLNRAYEINARQGIHYCSLCKSVFRIGLHIQVLPAGPFVQQNVPPDMATTRINRSLVFARLRSRRRRIKALVQLGLDDPLPEQPVSAWVPGEPINRVTIVRDPREAAKPEPPEVP
jgi:hypothetical protein